jgi:hypothetical protein
MQQLSAKSEPIEHIYACLSEKSMLRLWIQRKHTHQALRLERYRIIMPFT